MIIILYNPLSRNGELDGPIKSLTKALIKRKMEIQVHSLLEIVDVEGFINACHVDDEIIIVGGDGTLNHLANRVYDFNFEQNIYLFKAGTGNDFARSVKAKNSIIRINDYLKNLPKISFNDQTQYYLNGAGIGLDGYVCALVNESNRKKNKRNYFRNVFKAFKQFKPISGNIIVDGKEFREEKIWLAAAMNAQFFGGGMKIAPKASRENDHLDFVVVKNISKFKLALIFPIIYLGWHQILKKYVNIYQAHEIIVNFDKETYMQIDGEDYHPIKEIKIESAKLANNK